MIDKSYVNDIVIFECTLRDGSYAIDFKFTDKDTALLTGLLSDLNFKWIEIGHGFGIGASEKGKGAMPVSDEVLIRTARKYAKDSLLGMFFIPEIATMDDLVKAREAGLDFVRIGYNAVHIEKAFPYLEKAKELGYIAILNFMKTYSIDHKKFAENAKIADSLGAEVVYCVDSSGGMFPDDIARYIGEAKSKCSCEFGFHGHNNLQLAVANCIQAYKSGAKFIDGTFYGLGRSSGNAPVEVLVAVFEKMGLKTGVDLFKLMDAAEDNIWPLMSNIQMYDMMSVTMGYSDFHSSFLPKVLDYSRKHNIEIKRLVAEAGIMNPVNIDDKELDEASSKIKDVSHKRKSDPRLISFSEDKLFQNNLSNTMDSVKKLLDGMEISKAKIRNAKIVLELVPVNESEYLLMPEFIFMNDRNIVGRITYSSLDMLKQITELSSGIVDMYLIETGSVSPLMQASIDCFKSSDMVMNLFPVNRESMNSDYFIAVLDKTFIELGRMNILVYGYDKMVSSVLGKTREIGQVFMYAPSVKEEKLDMKEGMVFLSSKDDWRALELKFDLILYLENPGEDEIRYAAGMLAENGYIMSTVVLPVSFARSISEGKYSYIDFSNAYDGLIQRNSHIQPK